MKKLRSLSHTERGMLISIVVLLMLLALRWNYVRQRAVDGWHYLQPVDSAVLAQPNVEPAPEGEEACE
ncbi:MAG: hypothetical protein LBS94_03590 [Prevotellaceae bacterium]|nr:hypothetical protein [Prevotellaceae bacterium]